MKKVIFFFAMALVTTSGAYAQKFQGGEKNIEVEFTPLSGNPVSLNGIRFRMFNSETSAIRIGLILNNNKVTTVNTQQTKTQSSDNKVIILPELYDYETSSNIGLSAGYEMHFTGTDRLSPYVGGQISFSTGKEVLEREFHNANNADDQPKPENWQTWAMTRTQKTSNLGIAVLAGVDFYFVDNFYLGAEMGLGFQTMSYKDRETEAGNADAWKYSAAAQGDADFDQAVWNDEGTAVEYRTIIGDGDGNFKERSFGVLVQPTLRLGWLF
jgi:Putative OmpA-OmpF-like porin family